MASYTIQQCVQIVECFIRRNIHLKNIKCPLVHVPTKFGLVKSNIAYFNLLEIWFQQDGVSSNCVNEIIQFLEENLITELFPETLMLILPFDTIGLFFCE